MDDRWAVGLIWMLLMALGADWSGLHFMVGAFLAGAVRLDKGAACLNSWQRNSGPRLFRFR